MLTFFFSSRRRHTKFKCDWSSDVCSSDLDGKKIAGGPGTAGHDTISILLKAANAESAKINWVAVQPQLFGPMLKRGRSEEGRVGEEGRSRWWPDHLKKKKRTIGSM